MARKRPREKPKPRFYPGDRVQALVYSADSPAERRWFSGEISTHPEWDYESRCWYYGIGFDDGGSGACVNESEIRPADAITLLGNLADGREGPVRATR